MVAVATELARAGVHAEVGADDVIVHGGGASGGVTFRSYHDHRMAMAMAIAALAAAVGNSHVTAAECVSKTYRAFWSDAAKLGLELSPV